jgi:hypothetical protein
LTDQTAVQLEVEIQRYGRSDAKRLLDEENRRLKTMVGTITEEFYDSIFNVNVKGLLFYGAEGDAVAACLDQPESRHRRQQGVGGG